MNEELMTDDEIMRGKAMESGSIDIAGMTFAPTDCLLVSWMQRNNVLDDSKMDIVWRVFAFAYLHTSPRKQIRAVVNNADDFIEAVDAWMEKHNPSEADFKSMSALMNERVLEWFTSSSTLKESGSATDAGN
jgi:hypothetical protein